jgi:magnesium chelatase subunit D
MNPEEGELRPQLLDRFGLGVEVTGPRDPATRAAIVRRRIDFDADPVAFAAAWAGAEHALAARIAAARRLVRSVRIADRDLLRIAAVCSQLDLDGIRGDLVCAHAARGLAALDGLTDVTADHIDRAAHLALRHRLRRDPLGPPPTGGRDPAIDAALDRTADDPASPSTDPPDRVARAGGRPRSPAGAALDPPADPTESQAPPMPADPPQARPPSPTHPSRWMPDPDLAGRPHDEKPSGEPLRPITPAAVPSRLPEAALRLRRGPRAVGRPPGGRSPGGTLAAVDSRPARDADDVAVLPTLLARLRGDDRPRTPILGGGRPAVLCLIVDTSGSMAAHRRLGRVKGALEAAVRSAYARRDLVAVVAFGGDGARTLVEPGAPIERAAAAIDDLPAGGRTPLAAGIAHAATLFEATARGRLAGRARIAVLLTDGRAADPAGLAAAALRRLVAAADRTIVVDLEDGPVRLGLAAGLAAATGADLTRLVSPRAAWMAVA